MGQGAAPSDTNAGIRKSLYRRFWSVISNTGGWRKKKYEEKKALAMNREGAVITKREIMPQCVLKLCRSKYPNPSGRPYMDHMWE